MGADRDLIQFLANPTNRELLALLAVEPQYPRRLAELVGLSEDEASRRLRSLERLGVAEAAWANVGKNVRLYRLATARLQVRITPEGITVDGLGEERPLSLGRTAEPLPELARFIGRENELKELAALMERQRAVCVTGIGGAGKTSIASTFARRSGRPILWHTLAPGESGALLLSRLASSQRALDATDRARSLAQLRQDEDAQPLAAALVESIEATRTLVVLDRFETAGEGAVEFAAKLAQRLQHGRLLVTSRAYPAGLPRDVVGAFRLDGLRPEETGLLVRSLRSEPGGARDAGASAAAVHARTGGHALSVVLLSQAGGDVVAGQSTAGESAVRDFLVNELLPQMSESERDVLLALSVFQGPFLASEAEAVTQNRHTGHALLRLEARSLVGRAADRFVLHDLVRSFAIEVVPERRALHARAARVLVASGEATRVLEAVDHYRLAGEEDRAVAVVRQEATQRTYRFADLALGRAYATVLLPFTESPRISAEDHAVVELELGNLATLAGHQDAATRHLGRAAKGIDVGEPGLATALALAQARVLRLEGRNADAGVIFATAEAKAREAADGRLLVETLVEWAFCEEERSSENAFRIYERALAASSGTSDIRLLSLVYAGMARVASHRLDPRYLEWSNEALRLARLAGYLRGEASVYMGLTTHHIMHGTPAAGEWAQRYLEIANQLKDPWIRACALSDMAYTLSRQAQHEEAIHYAEECLALAGSIRSPFYKMGAMVVITESLAATGHAAEGVARAQPLLAEGHEELPGLVARLWAAVAYAYERSGRPAEAKAAHDRGQAILRRANIPPTAGPVYVAVLGHDAQPQAAAPKKRSVPRAQSAKTAKSKAAKPRAQ